MKRLYFFERIALALALPLEYKLLGLFAPEITRMFKEILIEEEENEEEEGEE